MSEGARWAEFAASGDYKRLCSVEGEWKDTDRSAAKARLRVADLVAELESARRALERWNGTAASLAGELDQLRARVRLCPLAEHCTAPGCVYFHTQVELEIMRARQLQPTMVATALVQDKVEQDNGMDREFYRYNYVNFGYHIKASICCFISPKDPLIDRIAALVRAYCCDPSKRFRLNGALPSIFLGPPAPSRGRYPLFTIDDTTMFPLPHRRDHWQTKCCYCRALVNPRSTLMMTEQHERREFDTEIAKGHYTATALFWCTACALTVGCLPLGGQLPSAFWQDKAKGCIAGDITLVPRQGGGGRINMIHTATDKFHLQTPNRDYSNYNDHKHPQNGAKTVPKSICSLEYRIGRDSFSGAECDGNRYQTKYRCRNCRKSEFWHCGCGSGTERTKRCLLCRQIGHSKFECPGKPTPATDDHFPTY